MNVSKGQGAKSDDLKRAFGTDNQKEICLQVCIKTGMMELALQCVMLVVYLKNR